ncbi:MAG: M61 family metallopeptidase [Zoogloeaceae bacterium]|nr:M61 family metallopeptidase [Zoogloeaceae bacterium]
MTTEIRYTITPHHPEAHLFRVTCSVAQPDPAGQQFRLPAWIPGSYMIREFARNIVTLQAEADGKPVRVTKLDKHTWRAASVPAGRTLSVTYDVYAWDLSVRAAHLDQTHGFFNGTSVFLAVLGQEAQPCLIDIAPPKGKAYTQWRVATALAPAKGEKGAAKEFGFGLYRAENYDELVDHPVEMGDFTHARFKAGGVKHDFVITGRHDCDLKRLTTDLEKICDWQIELFGKPAPVDRYVFMTMIVGDGYGGLEHRASTALLASRKDLPYPGMVGQSKDYRSFLGLCSHEYFHTWNVKRIKPAAFTPYDLTQENYTRLLWAFEGFTSYYDDLALVRSGVITPADYLELISATISRVLRGSGRLKQSVAESSFDAWTKFYRQDENAPNAVVSYYAKGSLIALALDLQLREASGGKTSLDDVMRLLWKNYGQRGIGVEEEGVFDAVAEVASAISPEAAKRITDDLKRSVNGTADLPLARLLKPFGVDYKATAASTTPTLGVRMGSGKEAKISAVYDGGPAQAAGLSAGDVLVALDGLKVTGSELDAMLSRRKAGDKLRIHAFRRDELMEFDVRLVAAPADNVRLALREKIGPAARRLRQGWLGTTG